MRIPGVPFVQGRNDYSDSDGRKYGIAIHNTSNDASDEGEANYAKRRTDGVSSHLYVDKDSVTQSLDTEDRAGHAGSAEGNNHALAVEITGSNGKSRAWWLANVAWDKLGRALAYVITHDPDYRGFQVRRASVAEMKSNPKVRAFYGHDDMRRAWGDTTHTDPGGNFPWDRLFGSVNAALDGEDDDMDAQQYSKILSDPTVAAKLRAIAVQYPVYPGRSLLSVVQELDARTSAILAAVRGADADQVIAEVRAQGDQTRAALLARVDELAPGLAAAVADRLGPEAAAAEIGEAIAAELASMLGAGASAGEPS
ncbi:peptidoglycan recognition family protein [Micromonosporaceae bacterium B7E4]